MGTAETPSRRARDNLDLFLEPDGLPQEGFLQQRSSLSVTELTGRIKGTLEPEFQDIWLQGEISNFRPVNTSGHLYFSLKDAQSMISCAFFGFRNRGHSSAGSLVWKDGMEVLAHGRVSVYGPRGSYQFIVDRLEPIGQGALQLAFDALKAKLSAEGYFAPERKRPLPRFARSIAVLTSPTSAALQDFLQVMKRRAPHVLIRVIPSLVQGAEAIPQLVRALRAVRDCPNPTEIYGDVLVVARGGGSIEDLWCFNDESVVRELSQLPIPVVTGIGHEIDFTIADFISDFRAPTPSAAAEVLSQGWSESRALLVQKKARLNQSISSVLERHRRKLQVFQARLKNPRDVLREKAQRLDDVHLRLDQAMRVLLRARRQTFVNAAQKLDVLSPLKVLGRGYAVVHQIVDSSPPETASKSTWMKRVVMDAKELTDGDRIEVQFRSGLRQAIVCPDLPQVHRLP